MSTFRAFFFFKQIRVTGCSLAAPSLPLFFFVCFDFEKPDLKRTVRRLQVCSRRLIDHSQTRSRRSPLVKLSHISTQRFFEKLPDNTKSTSWRNLLRCPLDLLCQLCLENYLPLNTRWIRKSGPGAGGGGDGFLLVREGRFWSGCNVCFGFLQHSSHVWWYCSVFSIDIWNLVGSYCIPIIPYCTTFKLKGFGYMLQDY